MADSNITKQALANALKELLEDRSFDKICVSDICDRCGMSRKSFYYHFRDKYDLVNWIFDTDVMELNRIHCLDARMLSPSFEERWQNIEVICRYFYSNRAFYRRVLHVEDENAFSVHFRDFIRPLFRLQVEKLLGMEDVPELAYDFVADGVICAIERWLRDKNGISAEEFMHILKKLIQILYLGLERSIVSDPKWVD